MAGRWQVHGQPAVTDEWLSQAANSRHPPEERPSTNLRTHRLTGDNRDSRETENMSVVEDFDYWRGKPDLAVAVAAIKALTAVIKRSKATTMMGLEIELKKASEELKEREKSSISLAAGCELFLRFVTRTSALEHEDINAGKERLIERGEQFSEISIKARQTIAKAGADFVRDGCTILTHGVSRVVVSLLKLAASQGKHFSVICPEGRPDGKGIQTARELTAVGIPVTLILDTGVAYVMERVDMVLCGAEGVVESGGIINNLGTYQIAVVARAFNKPVYVAAESYKFARLYPLDQRDLPYDPKPVTFSEQLPPNLKVDNPSRDYTPPSCLTLLFTDLGVLTPSAVSDELIQLYL